MCLNIVKWLYLCKKYIWLWCNSRASCTMEDSLQKNNKNADYSIFLYHFLTKTFPSQSYVNVVLVLKLVQCL